MNEVSLATAFIAGLLSFLSPCVLPLLPGYISFISGESIERLTSGDAKDARMKAIVGAVFFGAGFILVFVLFGATATKAGQLLQSYKFILARVAGVVLIILGLHMMGVFRISSLMMTKKWNFSGKTKAPFYVNAFLLGVAFVLGWTPCIGPILGAILTMAAQEATVGQGMFLLFVFGLGLWLPFLVSAAMLGYVISLIRKAGPIVVWVERVAGALLIVVGVLMATGGLSYLSSWMIRMFPVLGGF